MKKLQQKYKEQFQRWINSGVLSYQILHLRISTPLPPKLKIYGTEVNWLQESKFVGSQWIQYCYFRCQFFTNRKEKKNEYVELCIVSYFRYSESVSTKNLWALQSFVALQNTPSKAAKFERQISKLHSWSIEGGSLPTPSLKNFQPGAARWDKAKRLGDKG